MSTHIFQSGRRFLLTLFLAFSIALSIAYTPMLLDHLFGTTFTSAAYACQHPGGSCG